MVRLIAALIGAVGTLARILSQPTAIPRSPSGAFRRDPNSSSRTDSYGAKS
jgi:hypothetical protein